MQLSNCTSLLLYTAWPLWKDTVVIGMLLDGFSLSTGAAVETGFESIQLRIPWWTVWSTSLKWPLVMTTPMFGYRYRFSLPACVLFKSSWFKLFSTSWIVATRFSGIEMKMSSWGSVPRLRFNARKPGISEKKSGSSHNGSGIVFYLPCCFNLLHQQYWRCCFPKC